MPESNPRLIHRIYFDNFAPFHDPFEHYLESWAREMPGYKVMKWNMSNLDVQSNAWTRKAFEKKAPVFLSEYFRWKVLSEYGGIYLDADCEVLNGRVLHGLIEDLYAATDYDTFFGVEERGNGHPTAQTVAARKGSPLVAFMKSLYEKNLPELWEWRERRGLIGPQLMALYFLDRGINTADDGLFKHLDEPVVVDGCKVYPQTYFSPKFTILGQTLDYQEGKTCVYHMFANSNVDFSARKDLKQARERALTYSEYASALERAAAFPRRFDASWLRTQVGEHTGDGIRAGGRDGVAVFGPYTELPAGEFIVSVDVETPATTGTAAISVTSDGGARVLATRSLLLPLPKGSCVTTPRIVLDAPATNIEVVVRIAGISEITIRGASFDRAPAGGSARVARGSLKTLHRIYFGFDGKPDQFKAYLDTWAEQLPGYRIVHWNASNLPMDLNPYVRQLYKEKDHAFLTDYFRWFVLREHGGTYLDADVEVVNGRLYDQLIEELEDSTDQEAFIGIDERAGGWYTAHSMASKPQSDLSRFMCQLYENFGSFTAWRKKGFYFWAPQLVGLYFTNRGHHKDGMGTTPRLTEPAVISGVKIYPQDWFSPLAPSSDKREPFSLNALTPNTCLCHHFACSWHDAGSKFLQYSQVSGGGANVMLRDIAAKVAARRRFAAEDLFTNVGRKQNDTIRTTGVSGCLSYGPYASLAAGRYRVEFALEGVEALGGTTVDAVADYGNTTLLGPIQVERLEAGRFAMMLDNPQPQSAVEFRLHVDQAAAFALSEISVESV